MTSRVSIHGLLIPFEQVRRAHHRRGLRRPPGGTPHQSAREGGAATCGGALIAPGRRAPTPTPASAVAGGGMAAGGGRAQGRTVVAAAGVPPASSVDPIEVGIAVAVIAAIVILGGLGFVALKVRSGISDTLQDFGPGNATVVPSPSEGPPARSSPSAARGTATVRRSRSTSTPARSAPRWRTRTGRSTRR